jgi:hypothetical protein
MAGNTGTGKDQKHVYNICLAHLDDFSQTFSWKESGKDQMSHVINVIAQSSHRIKNMSATFFAWLIWMISHKLSAGKNQAKTK